MAKLLVIRMMTNGPGASSFFLFNYYDSFDYLNDVTKIRGLFTIYEKCNRVYVSLVHNI